MAGINSTSEPLGEYGSLLPVAFEPLGESGGAYHAKGSWTERHLQCVWFNAKLRPTGLTTTDGEAIEVLSPGKWNLEAGPDFLDAVLAIGPERRRLQGDVEIHVRPSGWTRHGHAKDPRYRNVIAHLSYYPGPRPPDLPPGVLSVFLEEPLLARKSFALQDIDLAAYPHAILPATKRPCQETWGDDPDRAIAVLKAAGRYRFERKRLEMGERIRQTGNGEEALYEGLMAALGYKRNATPFRLIARGYPLAEWKEGDPVLNYAVLLGLGGLLPYEQDRKGESDDWSARLWRLWWRNPRPPLDEPAEWRLDSIRPGNHPIRRLAAAASLFSRKSEWLDLVSDFDLTGKDLPRQLGKLLMRFSDWQGAPGLRAGTDRGRGGSPALLGASRAAVLVNNALMPYLASLHPEKAQEMLENLRPETINEKMKTMANHLFGRDHNPAALYGNSGLAQQGLLQIYSDFCLNSRDACRDCHFGHPLLRPPPEEV